MPKPYSAQASPRAQEESARQPCWVLWRRNWPLSQVEDAFMGGAAVAAHQVFAGSQAVLEGDLGQLFVPALLGGVEDDADVHHDIDEEAVLSQEGAQILRLSRGSAGPSSARR